MVVSRNPNGGGCSFELDLRIHVWVWTRCGLVVDEMGEKKEARVVRSSLAVAPPPVLPSSSCIATRHCSILDGTIFRRKQGAADANGEGIRSSCHVVGQVDARVRVLVDEALCEAEAIVL